MIGTSTDLFLGTIVGPETNSYCVSENKVTKLKKIFLQINFKKAYQVFQYGFFDSEILNFKNIKLFLKINLALKTASQDCFEKYSENNLKEIEKGC